MNAKLLTSAGCLLLVATALAPSVLSHDDRGFFGTNPSGVSGRYVGAAGPAVAIESRGTQAIPSNWCDLEVHMDVTVYPGNEAAIDGFDSGAGITPDTFDDGGIGGACHTIHYLTTQFNTPGCQGGNTARGANDGGGDLWVAAVCDWKTEQGSYYSAGHLMYCTALGHSFRPSTLDGMVGFFMDCAERFVDCMTDPDCALFHTESCGADYVPDNADFGYGSGSLDPAVFPAAYGIWPGNGNQRVPCSPGDEVASIYVFDTVATDGGTLTDPDGDGPLPPFYYPPNVPPVPVVYPALGGELWTDF